mmetsp:Transcript_7241/g.7484  ORF Transcript_7241/g.7484 Transcript_7241/m.7484 type:complete len:109 (-) Transcript_7241:112-438(-)
MGKKSKNVRNYSTKPEKKVLKKQGSIKKLKTSSAYDKRGKLNVSENKIAIPSTNSISSGLSTLQLQFQAKIEGARFRTINEKLYTCRGDEAFKDFKNDPSLFTIVYKF